MGSIKDSPLGLTLEIPTIYRSLPKTFSRSYYDSFRETFFIVPIDKLFSVKMYSKIWIISSPAFQPRKLNNFVDCALIFIPNSSEKLINKLMNNVIERFLNITRYSLRTPNWPEPAWSSQQILVKLHPVSWADWHFYFGFQISGQISTCYKL